MTLYDDMMQGFIDVHCHIDFEFSAKEENASGVSLAAQSRRDGDARRRFEIALVATVTSPPNSGLGANQRAALSASR